MTRENEADPPATPEAPASDVASNAAPRTSERKWGTPIPRDEVFLSVVIPVYNEEDTIEEIVRAVRAVDIRKEIVMVNDASTDGSKAILDRLAEQDDIRVFHHEKNKGKGAGLKTGFEQVRGNIVIIQDADLEYDPKDYESLLKPIIEGKADVVYGSRFLVRDYARVHLFSHYLGNRMLTFLSNVFTGLNLTDMETCYKVFRREVLEGVDLKSKRFNVEPEITAKVAKKKCRVYEVPVSYAGRNFEEGKKITWRDGFSAIWAIVKYRFVN